MEKTDILSLSLEELIIALDALGEKKFRAEQIFSWLHVKKVTEFEEMTNISLELRTKLSENFYIKRLNIAKRLESCTDNTIKYLYELDDGIDGDRLIDAVIVRSLTLSIALNGSVVFKLIHFIDHSFLEFILIFNRSIGKADR